MRRLNLRSNELPHYDCLHPPGVIALANSPNFPALEWLDVSDHHILDSGLEALAESPLARQLVTLLVAYNDIGLSADTDGIAALTAADWPNLRGLDLSGNAVSAGSVARLLNWRRLAEAGVAEPARHGVDARTRSRPPRGRFRGANRIGLTTSSGVPSGGCQPPESVN